ncbi:MAG: RtcB family protein, partial [Verrucomicrobiota bacterium]
HNWVERGEEGWLHRKGAAPSSSRFVLIPGSRGSFSYVVRPRSNDLRHGYSLAHGAGRKWDRASVKGRLENRYRASDLEKTALGSRVICRDKDLLFQEAPEAYKAIDTVIDDMVVMGLIEVVAVLRPVLTYKTNTRH